MQNLHISSIVTHAVVALSFAVVGHEAFADESDEPLLNVKPYVSPDVTLASGHFDFVLIHEKERVRVKGTFTEKSGKVWQFQSAGPLSVLLNTARQEKPLGGVDAVIILKKGSMDDDVLSGENIIAVFSRDWLLNQKREEHLLEVTHPR